MTSLGNLRRGYWSFLVFVLVFGCGAESEQLVYESVYLQLPQNLYAQTEIFQNSCTGATGDFVETQSDVLIEQDGNDFIWTQTGKTDNGEAPLKLTGRVCPIGDDDFELRLRGASSLRVSTNGAACRVSLNVPHMYGACGDVNDLCNDGAAVRLKWDVCSSAFWGRFPIGIVYGDNCALTPGCTLEMRISARVPEAPIGACTTPVGVTPMCLTDQQCVCEED